MLVTLDQVKAHVRDDVITGVQDDDLTLKIHAASIAVITYLKTGAESFVDSSGDIVPPVPHWAQMATLMLVASLYSNRGEDGGASAGYEQGFLPPNVTAWLYQHRDPALA